MSDRDYEVGYGKPPKAYQWQKGVSGNSGGRRGKPASTFAQEIENAWMEPVAITADGIRKEVTGFELITLQLQMRIAKGNKKAYKVFRKYAAFAKTKPRTIQRNWEGSAEDYARFLEGEEVNFKRRKKKREKLTPEERKKRPLDLRIARMKAGLEEIEILPGMSARDASDLYEIFRTQPSTPRRQRQRDRKGPLAPSEIFDRAMNSLVTLDDAGQPITVRRMIGVLKHLLANAIKGDVKSADMLIDMHSDSIKHGDFYPETRYI